MYHGVGFQQKGHFVTKIDENRKKMGDMTLTPGVKMPKII
jgi:hypothetical protein